MGGLRVGLSLEQAQLITCDFDTTKRDEDRITVVGGVHHVGEPTAEALRACPKPKGGKAT